MGWLEHMLECLFRGWTPRGHHIAQAIKDLDERLKKVEECAAKICPSIVGLRVVDNPLARSKKTMNKKVVVVWSDGFQGFDAAHVAPADWPTALSIVETSGNAAISVSGDTFTVTPGTEASVITATYGAFSDVLDVAATPATPSGIKIVDA